MSETFCQICRHPTPGHEPGCPVLTGEPQRGAPGIPQELYSDQQQIQGQAGQMGSGINPQDMQPYSVVCPHCGGLNGVHAWAGSGQCPGISTHWSAHGQGGPPFQGELTIIWKTEKEELIRRIDGLEHKVRLLEAELEVRKAMR